MSKFLNHYKLFEFCGQSNFFDLAPGKDPDNIIVTYDQNIVFVLKLGVQKPIHSWSATNKFISKVIYDKKLNKYAAAFLDGSIRLWDVNASVLKKRVNKKFYKAILSLVSSEYGTYILYKNGTCESLEKYLSTSKKNKTEQKNDEAESEPDLNLQIQDSNVHKLKNGNLILSYIQLNCITNERKFVILPIMDDSRENNLNNKLQFTSFSFNSKDPGELAAAMIVNTTKNGPSLMTVCNNGKMYMYDLTDYTKNSLGVYINTIPYLVVSEPTNRHLSILLSSLENDFILLCAHSRRNFKMPQNFQATRIWNINGALYIKLQNTVYVVRYNIRSKLQSELVGVNVNTDGKLIHKVCNEDDHLEYYFDQMKPCDYVSDQDDCVNSKDEIKSENTANFSLPSKSKSKKAARKKEVVFADGNRIPFTSPTKFQQAFEDITQLSINIILTRKKEYRDVTMRTFSNINATMFQNPEIEKLAINMEKSGASDEEIFANLSNILMKKCLLEDLHICMKRYPITSEKLISQLLAFLYQQYIKVYDYRENIKLSSKTIKYAKKNLKHCKVLEEKILHMLGTLLLCNFDSYKIAKFLQKDLNYKTMLYFMRFIHFCIMQPLKYTGIANKPLLLFNENYCLLDFHLLKWLGAIFNAQMNVFTTSFDLSLIKLLYAFDDVIDSIEDSWTNLSDLYVEVMTLLNLKEKELNKDCDEDSKKIETAEEKPPVNNYSIESVNFY